jgi:hypothetical protein
VSDVRQHAPTDAAAEIAKLPVNNYASTGPDVETDELAAARARFGGPVPTSVYPIMLLMAIVGAIAGTLYNAILGEKIALIPLAFALLAETWGAARWGKRKLGRPLTNDQRVRVAVWYTFGLGGIAAAIWLIASTFAHSLLRKEWVEKILSMKMISVILVFGVSLTALALLRYLLLTLFAPSNGSNGSAHPAKA